MTNLIMASCAKRLLHSTLETVLVTNSDQSVSYIDSWSDAKVSTTVCEEFPDSNISVKTVYGVRARAWGNLYKAKELTASQRMAALEQDNAELRQRLDEMLYDKVTKPKLVPTTRDLFDGFK